MRASVFALANIRTPKDAVRIAEQYGLLWHGPDAQELREPFTDWWETANDLRKTLNLCLALQHVRAGSSPMRELRSWVGRTSAIPDADILAHVAALITERVHHHLSEGGLCLVANVPTGSAATMFALGPATASPLHHAYFHLAQVLVHNRQLAICAEPFCARFFEQSDPRQQYCSPTCANRARQRRWVERARGTHCNHATDTNDEQG